MRIRSVIAAGLCLTLVTGCGAVFVPYDYEKAEAAKVKSRNYNFRWRDQKVIMSKDF